MAVLPPAVGRCPVAFELVFVPHCVRLCRSPFVGSLRIGSGRTASVSSNSGENEVRWNALVTGGSVSVHVRSRTRPAKVVVTHWVRIDPSSQAAAGAEGGGRRPAVGIY